MESQPQNPELRNNPENFLPCTKSQSLPSNLNFFGNRAVNKQTDIHTWNPMKCDIINYVKLFPTVYPRNFNNLPPQLFVHLKVCCHKESILTFKFELLPKQRCK